MMTAMSRGFYEFFAGGGMARAGLGEGWRCLFANDLDPKKAAAYASNWGSGELWVGDVREISTCDLPEHAELVWASFPCQDLSLAGVGAGLKGARSGTFWPFWKLIAQLRREERAPDVIILENVCGLLTSHGGADFVSLCQTVSRDGYLIGAAVIDAAHFVPQSRPRLFVIAIRDDVAIPEQVSGVGPSELWHPPSLVQAYNKLPIPLQMRWFWLAMPAPLGRNVRLSDMIDPEPQGVSWHSEAETNRLLAMMSPLNRSKVESARLAGKRMLGTVYKRTRQENGVKVQRAEVRFDEVSGCLRTPGGGSSRQTILVLEAGRVRSRLISARETARLMGLPEEYNLPSRYNEAYHLTGDGVAVPVVRHLAQHVVEPVLSTGACIEAAAA